MRHIKTNLYKFIELSEAAKQKAIEKNCDLNTNYDWWDWVYEDAETIGLKITGFDIDRGRYCEGDFCLSALEVAQNILNHHGESCETYQEAAKFLGEHGPVFEKYFTIEADKNSSHEDIREIEGSLIDMEENFKNVILDCYLLILEKQYEYLTSVECLSETLVANDFEFTEDGVIF
jgi:hypothetical protein